MEESHEKIFNDWIKFLNQKEIRFSLISASIYITAYDFLISVIIEKIKHFYVNDFDENGEIVNDKYNSEVKQLYKKDIIIASLMWLQQNKVISAEEVERVKLYREHRNEVAHELIKLITDSNHRTKIEYIEEIKNLLFKIHKWWFIEFEMQINPDLCNLNVDELNFDEVLILQMLPVNYMVEIINDEIKKKESD